MGRVACYACAMSLMEILYRVWKNEGEGAGMEAYRMCLALPIDWIYESMTLLERSATEKATHALSVADAWIAATAQVLGVTLVHKDPGLEQLPLLKGPAQWSPGAESGRNV